MQITENAWQVGGSGQTSPEDAAIYLIRFGEAAALIDATALREEGSLRGCR